MRLPIKNKQPSQILSLPDLSGGLNMRDGISEILDNQLTDCKNMWWYDGMLRTRAAIRENSNVLHLGSCAGYPNLKIKKHNCLKTYKEKIGCLFSGISHNYNTGKSSVFFFWCNENEVVYIGYIDFAVIIDNYFVCQNSDILYCFASNQKIYKYNINSADFVWAEVTSSEMYIPLVMMHCNTPALTLNTFAGVKPSGVMLEGYNILSDYYKISYNSFNPNIVTEDNQKHYMVYFLAESLPNLTENRNYTLTVVFTHGGTENRYTVDFATATYDGNYWWNSNEMGGDLYMKVGGNHIAFYDKQNNLATISNNIQAGATVTITSTGKDDLVITAPNVCGGKEKIFNMNDCEWFGGSAGLAGGTRLFLCGNKSNSDLVVWSGLNNPLYFPENSYFYVGNETGKVTGFGKQSDKLVIFKENETWFTEYRQNTNITAEDLINQTVIDITSSSAYFTLTQINSSVGCPYPDTIQLCRNRLVWLGNDNSVHTLVSDNQYNERSIFSVSEMVGRKIRELSSCVDVSACDWDGYYCLLMGNNMLLMDYNCYGYSHISGYSKTEDANIRIPWYLWEVPRGQRLAVIGDKLITTEIYEENGQSFAKSYIFNPKESEDRIGRKNSSIISSFSTKIFDFGLPHKRKNIEQINLQLGNNNGEAIDLYFITENGTEETQVFTDGTETQSYTAGYITSRAVFPCIKQVLRFGLKFECKGALAVDSVILEYRTLGGAR